MNIINFYITRRIEKKKIWLSLCEVQTKDYGFDIHCSFNFGEARDERLMIWCRRFPQVAAKLRPLETNSFVLRDSARSVFSNTLHFKEIADILISVTMPLIYQKCNTQRISQSPTMAFDAINKWYSIKTKTRKRERERQHGSFWWWH